MHCHINRCEIAGLPLASLVFWMILSTTAEAQLRRESFDSDPHWDAYQNRSAGNAQPVRQDFGHSLTNHAGGRRGEIGGFITPAAEPAYYGRQIEETDLEQPLRASGRFAATSRNFHVLVGFFHSDSVDGWRTPNTICLRLMGRGDYFYAYVEYCTRRWRAGGDRPQPFGRLPDPKTSRMELIEFPLHGRTYRWTLQYDPHANEGRGAVYARINNEQAVCNLDLGHKQDGARFNRFGILPVLKSLDAGGEFWLDDVEVQGQLETFEVDPSWEGLNNRRQYASTNIRPRFDFGFSPTRFAGGAGRGELGGLVFRGDCRYAERMAYYGDRVGPFSLKSALHAAGRISLRRGVSDSTALLGFFHSEKSMAVTDSQSCGWPMNFLGVAIEGPSSEGFLFYPAYRVGENQFGSALGNGRPSILPDGTSHAFSFRYEPPQGTAPARLIAALGENAIDIDLDLSNLVEPLELNRFGLVTTWIDGNSQNVYFDDLIYSAE